MEPTKIYLELSDELQGVLNVRKGKLYFVLADDVRRSRNKVNLNDFVERFSDECRASNKLLILDCCHANQSVVEWRPELSDRYFILTASERLEKGKELDALQAGFLTHHLQQALNEPPPEIVAADKTIRVSALYGWLVAEAKRHNSLEHAIQVPQSNLLGNQKGNFALATLTAATNDLPQALSEEERRRQAAEERYHDLAYALEGVGHCFAHKWQVVCLQLQWQVVSGKSANCAK